MACEDETAALATAYANLLTALTDVGEKMAAVAFAQGQLQACIENQGGGPPSQSSDQPTSP